MENIKYVVAPTFRHFEYWTKKLEIRRDKTKPILTPDDARGIDFTENNTLYLIGEEYDYPELIVGDFRRKQRDEYYEMLDIVRGRIGINKNKQKGIR